MTFLVHDFEEHLKNNTFFIFDEFDHYVTADLWTTVADNSGTITVSDGVGGVVVIDPSDGTQADNDQTYMVQTTETFKFATGKPAFFACKVLPVSNTIGSANFIAGFKNAVAAEQLADDGAVPVVTGSGAFFYKLDGGTKWVTTAFADGTESVTNGVTTDHTVSNNTYDVLVIEVIPVSSTTSDVHFYSADLESDGDFSLLERGLRTNGKQFVAQTITHSSATEMEVFFGVKEGAANLTTEFHVDWAYMAQLR